MLKAAALSWLFVSALLAQTPPSPHQAAPASRSDSKANIKSLVNAAWRGDLPRVKALIAQKLDLDAQDDDGNIALVSAFSHVEVLKVLIAAGATLEQKTRQGCTVLMTVASSGTTVCGSEIGGDLRMTTPYPLDSLRFLLSLHPDLEVTDLRRCTALARAARANWDRAPFPPRVSERAALALAGRASVDGVKLLLAAGARVEGASGCEDGSPLVVAAEAGNGEVVSALVAAGANKESTMASGSNKGETPLIAAAVQGHADVVSILLAAGADIEGRDKFPLFYAGSSSFNINYATALIMAARAGKTEVVRVLLAAGAKREATDHWGHTALDVARHWKHEDIVALLTK